MTFSTFLMLGNHGYPVLAEAVAYSYPHPPPSCTHVLVSYSYSVTHCQLPLESEGFTGVGPSHCCHHVTMSIHCSSCCRTVIIQNITTECAHYASLVQRSHAHHMPITLYIKLQLSLQVIEVWPKARETSVWTVIVHLLPLAHWLTGPLSGPCLGSSCC